MTDVDDYGRTRAPYDQYGYRFLHPATVEQQKAEMAFHFGAVEEPPRYVECGQCGSYHPADYLGDCRNDLYRIDDPDALHGASGWEEMAAVKNG